MIAKGVWYSLCRFVLEGAKGLKRRLVRGIVRTKGIALELSLTVVACLD
jgi:hypothetical protein